MGIGLDHWWSPDGAVARGGEEAREPEWALAVECVREMLREPPAPAELSREYGAAARHLTALSALEVVVADAAAEAVFQETEDADPRLVEALENVARNENLTLTDRTRATELLDELRREK